MVIFSSLYPSKHLSYSNRQTKKKKKNQKNLMFDRFIRNVNVTSRKTEWDFVFVLSSTKLANNSLWIGPVLFGLINFWFQSCNNNWFIKIQTWRSWSGVFFSLFQNTSQLYNCNDHSLGRATHTESKRVRKKRCDRTWPSDATLKMV